MIRNLFFSLTLLIASATVSAETDTPSAPEQLSLPNTSIADDDIRTLLKTMTHNAILPIVEQLDKQGKAFAETSRTFCSQPNKAGFQQVRQQWANTLAAWQTMDALLFGPAVEEQIDFTLYFQPAKKRIIKKVLKSEEAITTDTLKKAGVGAQGLAALEYVLFDREKTDDALLQRYQGTADTPSPHCTYLMANTELLQQNLHTVYRSWHPQHGNFADAFYTAGNGSAYYTEAYQPLEELMNKLYQSAQKVSSRKLGVPLGQFKADKVNAYKLEAWRSGHSLANIRANLQGIETLFNAGWLEWLTTHNQAVLAKQLATQLETIHTISIVDDDLFQALEQSPEQATQLYEATRELTRLIKTELAPAMGVQLGFNDNDGD